jgi:hypothetical protein
VAKKGLVVSQTRIEVRVGIDRGDPLEHRLCCIEIAVPDRELRRNPLDRQVVRENAKCLFGQTIDSFAPCMLHAEKGQVKHAIAELSSASCKRTQPLYSAGEGLDGCVFITGKLQAIAQVPPTKEAVGVAGQILAKQWDVARVLGPLIGLIADVP